LPGNLGTQVSLEVGDDHWLIIEHVGDVGYFVCSSLPTDRNCFNLIDPGLGDAITEGWLALERYTFPRYALVGQEMMLKAARTFFETGVRDLNGEWVSGKDAFYE